MLPWNKLMGGGGPFKILSHDIKENYKQHYNITIKEVSNSLLGPGCQQVWLWCWRWVLWECRPAGHSQKTQTAQREAQGQYPLLEACKPLCGDSLHAVEDKKDSI